MKTDPIVDDVRRIREEIMAECGNDPVAYAQRLKALQANSTLKRASRGPKRLPAISSAK